MTEGGYRIAVVGATGAVGAALLTLLEESEFPVAHLQLLGRGGEGDEADEGQTAVFANRSYRVRPLVSFDFDDTQLAFFCVPADVAAAEVPRATAAGCRVIDCSAAFRGRADVPLVVGGVNADGLDGARLVASPDAATVQAAAVLAPLAAGGIADLVVHSQLAVSDRGKVAVADLAGQTARLLNVQALKEGVFPAQIAFNVIAPLESGAPAGEDARERAFAGELRRLLGDAGLAVSASFSYVPVFYGHSQIVSFLPRQPLTAAEVRATLARAAGVELIDTDADSLSPVGDSHGGDVVVVGRVRVDPASGRVTLWTVADNVRKGAAVNTVEIARALLKPHP